MRSQCDSLGKETGSAGRVLGLYVPLNTTNSSVRSFCSVSAEGALANVVGPRIVIIAAEAWHVAVHPVNTVPPFPVTVDLVVEPNHGTSSQNYLGFPSAIKIFLGTSVSGLDPCIWRHRHCGIDFPGFYMSGALALSAAEAEGDSLAEACLGKTGNAHLQADSAGGGNALGYRP